MIGLGILIGALGLLVLEALAAIVLYVVWLRRSTRRDAPPAYTIVTPERAAEAHRVIDEFLELPLPHRTPLHRALDDVLDELTTALAEVDTRAGILPTEFDRFQALLGEARDLTAHLEHRARTAQKD
jgi:hypothetical protein